ncbi:hypothetical protein [Microbispora sp. GKU 823]|uniref:hypothetical protein n=1 Tax=Microbispora sp. GKU 823 TaxID=1652100 RepID=UPI00117FF11D|nr:hypothetical protein [Microbispora sp. GKU 823]
MSAQPPAPGPYSPDGRFWWDGAAWQPVQSPSQAPAPLPPGPGQPYAMPSQPGAPHNPGPYAPPAAPRPAGRGIGLVIGMVIAGLLLGGGIGAAVGLGTTSPKGGTTPPAFSAGFPGGDRRYLPGVTVAMIAEDWLKKANKWRCVKDRDAKKVSSGAAQRIECEPPDDRGDMSVDIEYDKEDKIREVEATCWLGLHTTACTSLFSSMADTVMIPQKSLRKKAADWAAKNADSERATSIGGIHLEGDLSPHGMRITPAI